MTTRGYHGYTFCHSKGLFHFITASSDFSYEAVTFQQTRLPFGGAEEVAVYAGVTFCETLRV